MTKANSGRELITDLFLIHFFTSVLCLSGAKVYYHDYIILIVVSAQNFAIRPFDSRSFRE